SGYWWAQGSKPLGPSEFLTELHEHAQANGNPPQLWEPAPTGENPLLAEPVQRQWPADPLGARRAAVRAGADLVTAAGLGAPDLEAAEREAAEHGVDASWFTHARLLLAEREKLRGSGEIAVPVPQRLSVSQLVGLHRDPAELAAQLHRPMPRPPAPMARRGTAFHAWLERRFTADSLLDLDEMPGATDADAASDAELPALREAFERSEWGQRVPARVEVPFAMMLAGVELAGRMDAVFAPNSDTDRAIWDVIDWKTGAVPSGDAARAAAVQLAAYRLAWARLAQVPLHQVRAGFHYVRANRTHRPVDLLDADGLAALITALPAA
ncbi:MAG: PD-(D/E)XK nuclease family protein, partial [Mycobacteriales bacterium]